MRPVSILYKNLTRDKVHHCQSFNTIFNIVSLSWLFLRKPLFLTPLIFAFSVLEVGSRPEVPKGEASTLREAFEPRMRPAEGRRRRPDIWRKSIVFDWKMEVLEKISEILKKKWPKNAIKIDLGGGSFRKFSKFLLKFFKHFFRKKSQKNKPPESSRKHVISANIRKHLSFSPSFGQLYLKIVVFWKIFQKNRLEWDPRPKKLSLKNAIKRGW